jgi:hypothetical protein
MATTPDKIKPLNASAASENPPKQPRKRITQEDRNQLAALLDKWATEGDEQDQQEVFELFHKKLGKHGAFSNGELGETNERLSSSAPDGPASKPSPKSMTQEQREGLIALLDKWATDDDEEEQKAAFADLKKALGEERTISSRKLFNDTEPQASNAPTPQTPKPSPKGMTQDQREKYIALMQKWREEGDEQEQRESFEFLKKALGEDRTISNRKLF